MKQLILLGIRTLIATIFVVQIFKETGYFTAAFAGLTFIMSEMIGAYVRNNQKYRKTQIKWMEKVSLRLSSIIGTLESINKFFKPKQEDDVS